MDGRRGRGTGDYSLSKFKTALTMVYYFWDIEQFDIWRRSHMDPIGSR